MQPTLCSRCKKNIATVFITRMEGDKTVNEGLCLKCAKSLGLPQVNEMMQRMGITDEDLDNLNNEMMQAMDSIDNVEDLPGGEDDEESGKTATFPFLNRLFNNGGEPSPKEETPAEDGSRREKKEGKPNGKRKFLEGYCISLNRKAKEGKLDPVIGRAEEIERVIQILNRRQKNNPCLIGEPGVGKTAIAEGLAQRIVAGDVPFKLRDKEVYLLDLTALVAGTQFRGQFEQRMKGLIDEVKKLGNIILMIDEIHNIVGAGDAEGSMNAANILKPALSRGEIQVIGATTFNEYRKSIEKDSALERRFQPVTVNEPSIEDSIKATATLLNGETYEVERVLYYDTGIDIAVIKVSRTNQSRRTTSAFNYLDLVGTADIRPGDPVYAIGNPLGLGLAISSGIIGSTAHELDRYALPCIVNSADISRGSSGGALMNAHGQVIGVTSGAYTYGNNMYLAVPVDPVMAADLTVSGWTLKEVKAIEAAKDKD